MKNSVRKLERGRYLAGFFALLLSCQPSDERAAQDAPFVGAEDSGSPVVAKLLLTVDPQHAALRTPHREPQHGPAQVSNRSPGALDVVALAKSLPQRPDRTWVDLYIVNHADRAVRDLQLTASGGDAFDVNDDPFSDHPLRAPIAVGGVAAHGVTHAALTVPSAGPSTLSISLSGTSTSRSAKNSAPIALAPDGRLVWTVVPDANLLVAVDTATEQRAFSIAIPGRPSSVAVTPDGARLLVASADANTVSVIDPAARAVVQTLSEQDGLGRDLRHIVVSPDGGSAYVSAYVGDRVTRLVRYQSGRFSVTGSVAVGRRPLGLAIAADGSHVLVSHHLPRGTVDNNETWVSVISAQPFALHHEVLWRDAGNRKEAACLGQKYGQPADKMLLEGAATQLAGVFLPPQGNLGWIPGLRIGPTAIWELAPGKVIPGIATGAFSPGFVFFLDSRGVERTAAKLHPLVLDAPDANIDFLRCAKLDYDSESPVRKPVDMEPDAQWSDGAAIPTGVTGLSEAGASRFVAFSPGGRRAFVLSYNADEVQVYDAVTQHPTSIQHARLSGANPTGLALSPDGRRGYVSYDNSLYVSVLDLSSYADPEALPVASFVPFEYRKTGRANNSFLTESRIVRFTNGLPLTPPIQERKQVTLVDGDPLAASVRRGKILFHSTNPEKYPELTSSRQLACGTCHPDGGHDGGVWATTEGERRTLHLRGGVAGRGWLHQMGTHRDIQEFVRTVVPERLRGTGLSEPDYQALAEYVAFHIPKLQSPPTDPQQAARGQELFAKKCAGCHRGDKASGGAVDPADPFGGGVALGPQLYDVGTSTRSAFVAIPTFFTSRLPPPASTLYELIRGDRELGEKDPVQMTLGFRPRPNRSANQFRPPALVNVWDYSVFFHSGAEPTLRGSVTFLNKQLSLEMTDAQIDDVVEYLKTL
ncbi:MAG: c-type cytochrome [Polyangia bacterium]